MYKLALILLLVCTASVSTFAQSAPSKTAHCSVDKGDGKVPYPDSLKGSGVKGTVILAAIIGVNGCASDVRVVHKVHPQLDALAKSAVNSWKFSPATKDGKPVKVLIQIAIDFEESSS